MNRLIPGPLRAPSAVLGACYTGEDLFFNVCGFRKFWRADSGNTGHLRRCSGGGRIVKPQVLGPQGWSVEHEQAAAYEDAIDEGLGEVFVVEHAPPGAQGLVGREDSWHACGDGGR